MTTLGPPALDASAPADPAAFAGWGPEFGGRTVVTLVVVDQSAYRLHDVDRRTGVVDAAPGLRPAGR